MDELQTPYNIACGSQTFGHFADIYHALTVIKLMRLDGFKDIYLYQDNDVFPLFSTNLDHDIVNDKDVLDAREIVLFRIFEEAN